MNQVVLIGNGFDLAHGLKTSYSDFILWYFNEALKEYSETGYYEDVLISITKIIPSQYYPKTPYSKLSDVIKCQIAM